MLFNQNKYMNDLAGIAAVFAAMLVGLCSCVQIEDKEQENGAAYISFASITIDNEVEGMVLTKANVPAGDLPDAEDFTVRISGQNINDIVFTPGNLPTEMVEVMPGTYTVEATYGSNGFDGPYFYKSQTLDLAYAQTATVSLTDIPLANAMVAMVLPDGILQHLDINSMQLTDGNIVKSVEPGQYVYVPAGIAISAEFSGINSLGESKSISYPMGILESQHAYMVTCDLSLPTVNITLPDQQAGAWATRLYVTPAAVVSEISADKLVYEAIPASSSDWSSAKKSEVIEGAYHVIKGLTNGTSYKVRARLGAFCSEEKQVTVKSQLDGASISASHTYSGSVLTGSKATANIGFPSGGILRTLYDAGLLTIKGSSLKYGSNEVRTMSGLSGDMAAVSGWPYLPKGTGYTTEIRHRCKGDTEDVISSIASINVPAPTFTVGVSAYTSYNKYLERDLNFANNPDNKYTVFARQATVSISNELLGNTNYSKSSSITFNGGSIGTFDNNSKSFGNATNCTTWQNYPLVASMTFDGVTKSATKDCHITGLPYLANPPTEGKGWSKVKGTITWETEYVDLFWATAAAPEIVSPAFYIPQNINVEVQTKIVRNKYTFLGGSIHGEIQIYTQSNSKLVDEDLKSNSTLEKNYQTSMSSDANKWTIKYNYMATGPRTYVYKFNILYR